ncbi:hypothetical protein AAG570_009261 [Ranatra chinensis]|uniref:Uncharacterized protein n=1 Tax=Ranatra chinensis TaxID=642074 RepID=A0ABD0YTC4_9HEMI
MSPIQKGTYAAWMAGHALAEDASGTNDPLLLLLTLARRDKRQTTTCRHLSAINCTRPPTGARDALADATQNHSAQCQPASRSTGGISASRWTFYLGLHRVAARAAMVYSSRGSNVAMEQLRKRKEDEEKAAEQEMLNRSLRGSKKLQALESSTTMVGAGLVNEAFAPEEPPPPPLPPLPHHKHHRSLHNIVGGGSRGDSNPSLSPSITGHASGEDAAVFCSQVPTHNQPLEGLKMVQTENGRRIPVFYNPLYKREGREISGSVATRSTIVDPNRFRLLAVLSVQAATRIATVPRHRYEQSPSLTVYIPTTESAIGKFDDYDQMADRMEEATQS